MKMNKFTFRNIVIVCASVLLAGCSQYKVYSVKDNPMLPVSGGVVYALPRTQVCVAVTVQRRDLSKAPYSAYATDYLGVSESDINTDYHIVSIDVDGVNVADPDNWFFVKVNRGSVTVDDRHLLLAIGREKEEIKTENGKRRTENAERKDSGVRAEYNLYDRVDTFYTRYDKPDNPTMVSSRKDVRTAKQRAAAAAERLEEIQSKQEELLNGEYEGSYSTEAVQYIYKQLQRQEAQIINDFCGELTTETVRFYVDPQMRRKEDFCDTIIWFSPTDGFVGDAEHLPKDAYPVVCFVHNDNNLKNVNRFVRYHTSGITQNSASGHTGTAAAKSRTRNGFRYRIPASASVEVTTPEFSVSRQVPFSQLGPIVELPRRRIKALFDAKTLDLRELERTR